MTGDTRVTKDIWVTESTWVTSNSWVTKGIRVTKGPWVTEGLGDEGRLGDNGPRVTKVIWVAPWGQQNPPAVVVDAVMAPPSHAVTDCHMGPAVSPCHHSTGSGMMGVTTRDA